MKCGKVEKLLDRLIENSLDTGTKKEILEHIDSCSSCNLLYSKWQKVINILETPQKLSIPANFDEELHRKLVQSKNNSYQSAGWMKKTFWIPQSSMVRAVIVLLIVCLPAYLIIHQYNIKKANYQARLCAMQTCEAPINKTIVLNFSINAKETLKDVTLTVKLPEELELVHTGDFSTTDHTVVWQGDLLKGNNSISIKVKSNRGGEWQIKALLEKEGKSKLLEKTLRTI